MTRTGVVARTGVLLAVVGLVGVAVEAVADPRHALLAWLAAFGAGLSTVLATMALVMTLHVARAEWWRLLRPLLSGVIATLPVFVVLFVPIALGIHRLYPWAVPGPVDPALLPDAVVRALEHQRVWNATPFFLARSVVYFGVWISLALLLARADAIADRAPTSERPERFEAQRTVSGAGLPILALTTTFAAFDWLMSVEPGWVANSYGLYVFTGGLSSAVALLAVLVWLAEGSALLPLPIRPSHVHAVGRLLLMAVVLWAYVGFFQLMLVWIADMPRESSFYRVRLEGPWRVVDVILALGHFVVPFFALLSRPLKRSTTGLAIVAILVLVVSAVDVVWLVLPQAGAPRLLDVAPFSVVYGILVAYAAHRAQRAARAERATAVDPVLRASSRYVSP